MNLEEEKKFLVNVTLKLRFSKKNCQLATTRVVRNFFHRDRTFFSISP